MIFAYEVITVDTCRSNTSCTLYISLCSSSCNASFINCQISCKGHSYYIAEFYMWLVSVDQLHDEVAGNAEGLLSL